MRGQAVNDGVAVLGGGGHAKVVVATLQAAGVPVAGVFDDGLPTSPEAVLGVDLCGPLQNALERGITHGVIAIGDNDVRRRVQQQIELEWVTVVHPTAIVHSSVLLGEGTVVFAGAVIQPGTKIGRHSIVNTSASIDHDCTLGDYVLVGPGAHLAGAVHVGDGVLLGVGSAVIPCRKVGAWATVGAGAVITENVAPGALAVGVPARTINRDG